MMETIPRSILEEMARSHPIHHAVWQIMIARGEAQIEEDGPARRLRGQPR